jgi:hypothetical protein
VARRKIKKMPGLYEELLTKGEKSTWMHDIEKDLNRTFPGLPYFSLDSFGNVG